MNGRAYLARFPNRLHRHFGNRASRCVERAAQDEAQALHRQALTRGAHSHAWPSDIVPFELHGGGFRNIFRTLEEDFQQMRNRVFSHPAAQRRAGFAAADLQETEKQISLKLDVPGISKENIKVQLGKDRKLTISGQRESAAQTETPGGMQRTERSFGKFQREFHLPESADTASIAAKAENGVLSIEIQKLAPEARNISEITVA